MDFRTVDQVPFRRLGNINLTKATFARDGTNARQVKTTSAITYINDGVLLSKAALATTSFSSGHVPVPNGYSCLFVFGLDAAGNVTSYQGRPFKAEGAKYRGATTDVLTQGANNVTKVTVGADLVDFTSAFLPAIPSNITPFGVVKVANASGADWTASTNGANGTALNAAGVTDTYYDVSGLPAASVL